MAFSPTTFARQHGLKRARVANWATAFRKRYGAHGGKAAEAVKQAAGEVVMLAFKRFTDGWDDPATKPADRRADLKMLADLLGVGKEAGVSVNVDVEATAAAAGAEVEVVGPGDPGWRGPPDRLAALLNGDAEAG